MKKDNFIELIEDSSQDVKNNDKEPKDCQDLTKDQEDQLWGKYYESIGFFNS